jgi:transcriptional regulator with XRE-family HTH domain
MTQVELAYRASINPATLSQIETGVRTPTMGSVEKIAAALNMTASELLKGPTDPKAGAPLATR